MALHEWEFSCWLYINWILVLHCGNNSEYSTRYLCHRCVVVSQRCTRHRLLPPPCADTNIEHCIHCYFHNAVLAVSCELLHAAVFYSLSILIRNVFFVSEYFCNSSMGYLNCYTFFLPIG